MPFPSRLWKRKETVYNDTRLLKVEVEFVDILVPTTAFVFEAQMVHCPALSCVKRGSIQRLLNG